MLFRIIRLSRQIRIFFGGSKWREDRFKLFQLPQVMPLRALYAKLIPHCYQYNFASHTYKKQIFTVRRLMGVEHQIHLRFYSDGWVTGHYELQVEFSPMQHLKGKDLRKLTLREITSIRGILE